MSRKFIVFIENQSSRDKPRNMRSPPDSMQDLAKKEFRPVVPRVYEKIVRVVFFNELAKIHEYHPMGDTLDEW